MTVALFLILLISPTLAWPDSQRGDWYETYNSDGWTYDVPVEAQLTGAGGGSIYSQSGGQWQDAYTPVKRQETPKKEDKNILQKFKDELSGVGKNILGGINKLTGRAPAVPVQDPAEDRSADPILDFDLDFNIGHPKLGYLGNGFHTRAAGSDGSVTSNRNSDLSVDATSQSYSNFQTPFVASNPRPQRDSPASNYYEYQEPAHQGFIPVSQPDRSHTEPQSGYETPSSSYNAPSSSYNAPSSSYDTPNSYYAPDSGYSADPSSAYDAPPYAAPSYEADGGEYYEDVTKPPLHIKIKQDLEGLVDGIVGPIKSLIPGKKKTPITSSYAEPEAAYQLVPASSYQPVEAPTSYDPVVTNHLETPSYTPEVANRYESPAETAPFSTPYGKPPLMEKIKQDFFSWLPKAKREIKYTTNYQQPQPQPAYPAAPAFDPVPYPEQSLPQKQQHVRQATFNQAAASTPSFLVGSEGGQLFKIIQVQTESGSPLYQIVPTTPTAGQQQPVLPAHNTATTTYNTSPSFSHTPSVHEQQYQQPQQQPEQFIPAQSAPAPAVAYQSQVAHPLPPPQQPAASFVASEASEKSDIFSKVVNDLATATSNTAVNPRTRTGRKTDAIKAGDDSSISGSTNDKSVFVMSAPDMSKESPLATETPLTESEVVIAGKVPEALEDADLHTYQLEVVHENEPEVDGEPEVKTLQQQTSSEEEAEIVEYLNSFDKVKDESEYEVEETLP